jgi:hypothetical protein
MRFRAVARNWLRPCRFVKCLAACGVVLALTAAASAQYKQPLRPTTGGSGPRQFEGPGVTGQGIGMLRSREASNVTARARHFDRASRAFQSRHLQARLQSRQEERNRVGTVRIPVNGELRLEPSGIPLRERLAHIDRVRDQAIETGNLQMLETADRLERQIRQQYTHRHPRLGGMRRAIDNVSPTRPITSPENRSVVMTRQLHGDEGRSGRPRRGFRVRRSRAFSERTSRFV